MCLNTVVVGLDAVEKGHEKPETLDISWAPDDRIAASRKARKFVVEAALVRCFEALLSHCSLVSALPRFADVTSQWDSNTKRASKIWSIYRSVLGEHYLVSSAVLVAHWRNRIIHPKSQAKFEGPQKRPLQFAEDEIFNKYKNLKVDCLLSHFEEGRPTLKDVSCLIAMMINLAKEVDVALSSDMGKDDLDAWLEKLGLFERINRVSAETKPEKTQAAIKRVFKTYAPDLLAGYETYYSD